MAKVSCVRACHALQRQLLHSWSGFERSAAVLGCSVRCCLWSDDLGELGGGDLAWHIHLLKHFTTVLLLFPYTHLMKGAYQSHSDATPSSLIVEFTSLFLICLFFCFICDFLLGWPVPAVILSGFNVVEFFYGSCSLEWGVLISLFMETFTVCWIR